MEKQKYIAIPEDKAYHFILIGAGGTGGFILHDLLRSIAVNEQENIVTIIDGDNIEAKNLVRQNFYQDELGANKAKAIAKRYQINLGSLLKPNQIHVAPAYLSSEQDLTSLMDLDPTKMPVIIGAVDNNATRHLVNDTLSTYQKPVIYIDAGNAKRNGQVVIGSKNITQFENKTNAYFELTDFPNAIELFPEAFAKTDRRPDELSCADHSLEAPQTMVANTMSAAVTFAVLNKLMAHEKLFQNVIKFNTETINVTGH